MKLFLIVLEFSLVVSLINCLHFKDQTSSYGSGFSGDKDIIDVGFIAV